MTESLLLIFYSIMHGLAFWIFIERTRTRYGRRYKVDTEDLIIGFVTSLIWPFYLLNLVLLRLINGEWHEH